MKQQMQQQMMRQQMIQQQMMQQQMMQQQMMQQQMMAAQADQAQQAAMQNILNQSNTGISIIFRQSVYNNLDKIGPIMIHCFPDEEVSSIIEKYRNKSNDRDPNKKFIFNAKNLSPYLSVAEAGITNNSNIFVVKTKSIQENK